MGTTVKTKVAAPAPQDEGKGKKKRIIIADSEIEERLDAVFAENADYFNWLDKTFPSKILKKYSDGQLCIHRDIIRRDIADNAISFADNPKYTVTLAALENAINSELRARHHGMVNDLKKIIVHDPRVRRVFARQNQKAKSAK